MPLNIFFDGLHDDLRLAGSIWIQRVTPLESVQAGDE